jgi:hypothetical protein
VSTIIISVAGFGFATLLSRGAAAHAARALAAVGRRSAS